MEAFYKALMLFSVISYSMRKESQSKSVRSSLGKEIVMRGKRRILRYAVWGALTCLSGAVLPGVSAAGTGIAAAAETATAAETAAAAGKAAVSGMSLPASPAVTEEKPVAAALPARTCDLTFHPEQYEEKSLKLGNQEIKFRAYENIVYVRRPALDTAESMSIYVPEAYFERGGTVNGYTKETAPIFLPNGVGGYMPGSIAEPSSEDRMSGGPNASLVALSRGYVVAAPAVRGRTTQDGNGVYVGKAPALIVDYKAAVRYLRCNKDRLPAGDTEKIVSDGTSAGGALSALLGATGNSPDYAPYLSAIGAADERDDIFASMDYCPITNLDHADMAYEWIFSGVNEAYQRSGQMMMPPAAKAGAGTTQADIGAQAGAAAGRPLNAPTETQTATPMTAEEITVSKDLKAAFPAYLNRLGLKDPAGNPLRLNADGTGSFADYIKSLYLASAQTALDKGEELSDCSWLTVKDGRAVSMDLSKYAAWATRLKAAPAFDKLDLSSGENDEFGDEKNAPKHFTAYGLAHSTKGTAMAGEDVIRLMTPLYYIGKKGVTTAPYWRIRHGAKDRDTSLAVPAILALTLENAGKSVDFSSPWGKGHAGDYDLDELFDWIDSIAREK